MKKSKHRLKNFLQAVENFLLIKRNFRYEIDRKPRKLALTLGKYGETHPTHSFKLQETKNYVLWHFDLLEYQIPVAHGEIYLEAEHSVLEGAVVAYKVEIVFTLLLSLLPLGVLWLWGILSIVELVVAFPLMVLILLHLSRIYATAKSENILLFLNNLVDAENIKMEREWALIELQDELEEQIVLEETPLEG